MVLSGCYNLPFLLDLYECFTVPNLKALAPDFSMKNVVKVNELFIFKIFTEFVGSRWIYADWEKKLPNFKVQNAIFWMSNVRRTYNSNLITAIFFLRETAIQQKESCRRFTLPNAFHIYVPSAPILNPRRFPAWFSGYFLPVLSQNIYPRHGGGML